MKKLSIKKWVATIGAACFMGTSAFAIGLNDPGVVGLVITGEPSSAENEILYANTLLSKAANTTSVVSHGGNIGDKTYVRSALTTIGSGSVTGGIKDETGNLVVPSGYEYVLAKYDGPNGGDVLYYLGGAGMTLSAKAGDLFGNGKDIGLSHFTVFNGAPPPPGVPDGGSSLAMLGVAVAGFGFLRRKLS